MAAQFQGRQVMLIAETQQLATQLAADIEGSGVKVKLHASLEDPDWVRGCQEDGSIVVVHTSRLTPDVLDQLRSIKESLPRPIVLFTDDPNPRAMDEAIGAGVAAYVVQGFSPQRLTAIIDLAIVRFNASEKLDLELQAMKDNLAERKIIERAKGRIMRTRMCDEDEAYGVLRKMAMDQKKKIATVAREVILIAEALQPDPSKK